MKRSSWILLAAIVLVMVLSVLVAFRLPNQASAAVTPQQAVQRAWELAKQSGSYRFSAQVDQFTVPLPIPQNIGKQSKQQSAQLEGSTNLLEHKMDFTLLSQGGSVLDPQSGTQIKIDSDKAYSRQGEQAWREIDDFTGSIAPQSDFMAFLAGAKNIAPAPASAQAGEQGGAHYTFEVNGPGFADYIQGQLEQQLAVQGKLPPGTTLNVALQFASLSGTGEIWLGADGLPVRQVLHVQFPPTAAEQVQADIVVTFKDFAPLPAAAAARPSLAGLLAGALQSATFHNALLATGFLALLGICLLAGLRSKPAYAAIVIVTSAALVIGPLLQQARAAGFMAEQRAQAGAQEQRQHEAEVAQAVSEAAASQADPNVSPLQKALGVQASASQPHGLVASLAAQSSVDSDNDGLPDDQEALLGTSPTDPDTDGDTVTDTLEVQGFSVGGKTWYGDPLNPDTNQDGVGDLREWGKDTDGDNTPDMWSRDNDGDGVPDQADLSPFQKGPRTYDSTYPLSLRIDQLVPNTPTYVEFQVRPTNLTHLRYALNVLDWPKGDVQGQMMDVDGLTFKDVYPDSDNPPDAYGDIRLVPMLEIQITGSPTNLPDATTLQGYGITVRDIKSDGSQKAVYVPLQIVTDGGDNRVAFYGKMFYTPGTSWGQPHLARLVWTVQALVDICDEDGFEDDKCKEFEKKNDLQVIQIYYDSFTLTGLNLREDHGNQWEVAYKDPAVITQTDKAPVINQLDPLSDLVFGLDHSFLAGRLGPDGQRDFPVTEVRRRFDHTINASVPISPTRFDISDNVLLVNPYRYAHLDLAYQQLAMTETKRILNIYTPYWSAKEPITPTLLFAHEEYYRPLNLDSMGVYKNITVSSDGLSYVLALPNSAATNSGYASVQVITATAVNWAPYQYQNGAWAGAPIDVYLDGLSAIYPPSSIDPDPAVALGGEMFLEEYYANIYQGYFNVVEEGEEKIPSPVEETDEVLAEYGERWEMVYEPIKIGLECFFEVQLPYRVVDAVSELKLFFSNVYFRASGQQGPLMNFESSFEYEHFSAGGMLAEGIAGLAWLITHIPPIHEKLDESVWGKLFIVSISASFVCIGLHKAVKGVGRHTEGLGGEAGGAHASELNGSKAEEGGLITMIVITAILILVNVGVFIYTVATAHEISGVQLSLMVANLIATIVVLLIFTVISLIPEIGPLIVAIYNLFNTFLTEIFGVSFTEALIETLTEIFYKVDPMTSLSPTVGDSVYGFTSDAGISVGNAVNIQFPMNVKARQEDPQSPDEASYVHNYYDDDLLKTNVTLIVDDNESVLDQGSQWHSKTEDHYYKGDGIGGADIEYQMYHVHGDLTGKLDPINFLKAGINLGYLYDSKFKYHIHVYTCTLYLFCDSKGYDGSSEQDPSPLYFDVMPKTLDEFYAWNWTDPVRGLRLPIPKDWDNDGLISLFYSGGTDANDANWDQDGDLLSDGWETSMAATPPDQGGFAFTLAKPDTDDDGLSDGDEARLGTDPAQVDSDGDGRSDYDEVTGYLFTYTTGKSTLVRSSPLAVDTDGDSLSDEFEYFLYQQDPVKFPYNPNVWNSGPLNINIQAGNEGYLAPGSNAPVTVTLQNHTDLLFKGQLTTTLPSSVAATAFDLKPQDMATQYTTLSIQASQPSSQLAITSTACAMQAKPLVHLAFDETSGKTFLNQAASHLYDATCNNQLGCPVAGVPGRLGKAVHFNAANQRLVINQSEKDLNFSGAHPFSLSVWVKPDPVGQWIAHFLISKSSDASFFAGYNLLVNSDKSSNYDTSFNNEQLGYEYWSPYLPTTAWSNLIAISDGSNLKLYINGVLVSGELNPISGYLMPSDAPVTIGAISDKYGTPGKAYGFPYVGYLDELYIYDRTLSDDEIYQLSHPNALNAASAATSACDLITSSTATVTVDADLPSASITSPAEGAYLNVTGYQVVGGAAHDPTSFIGSVEVSVDSVLYQPASGAESWAYTWDTRSLAEGGHTLDARAVDAVGNIGPEARVFVIIDRTPPQPTTGVAGPLRVSSHTTNNWYIPLAGNVVDPNAGTRPGSGVASLEALLDGDEGMPYGGWQPVQINQGSWSLEYALPLRAVNLDPVPSPTGHYTLTLRASDNAGNVTPEEHYVRIPLDLDNTPPDASVSNLSPTATITAPMTLTGLVTDTSGVSALKVALVPVEQVQVSDGAALALHLNEPAAANGQSFLDASGFNQAGYSAAPHFPQTAQAGKVDEAVLFDGVDDFIQWNEPIQKPFTNTLTAAAWFKASGTPQNNASLLSLGSSAGLYWKNQGGLTFGLTDQGAHKSEVSSGLALADGQWHHVVGAWDGEVQSIYVDGVLAADITPVGFGPLDTSASLLVLGNNPQSQGAFHGLIDEVMLFPRGFTAQDVADLYQQGNINWQVAQLAQPGVATSWTYTLSDTLEGLYELELRGVDSLGNRSDDPRTWNAWQGEIDLRPPQVAITAANAGWFAQVTCASNDFNLQLNGYQCPCPVQPEDKVYYNQVSEWYQTVTTDTTRLYGINSTCQADLSENPAELQACDRYGKCAAVSTVLANNTAAGESAAAAALGDLPLSTVVTPGDKSVLTSLDPLTVTVGAQAPSGLQAVTLTLDGGPLYTFNFPDASLTRTLTSTTWTPASDLADGAHVFQTEALDWNGQVQTQAFTTTLVIDTQAPAVGISPTVFTTTHVVSNWGVNLTGPVSDTAGVASMEIAVDGGFAARTPAIPETWASSGLWNPASISGGQWRYAWRPYPLPDGEVVTITARATDLGAHRMEAARPVVVDITPPTPVTVTLAYTNAAGVLTPVASGDTIRDVLNPNLLVTWTPSSDGSGLGNYLVGLIEGDQPDPSQLQPVSPDGPLAYSQAAAEAHAYTAYVIAQDIYGNQAWNSFGPVYMDTSLTPDLMPLPVAPDGSAASNIYQGWRESGASQIGMSRVISETAAPGLSLSAAQRLYLTWDASALRLNWTGADWETDGDLYIYLNTGSGPASDQAYNPYPATAGDTLTLPFAADTLVQVTGPRSARLKHWDGSAWADALPGDLAPAYYQFTPKAPNSLTDLYLPFALLGIANPATTSLDLIAFGSQKDALRLWTVQPVINPHDSPVLSKLLNLLPDQHHLVLKNAYHWPNLALQQRPDLGRYLDVDVRSLISANPSGVITETRLGGRYWPLPVLSENVVPLIGEGQVITYTLYYLNLGSATAPGAHLTLAITATGSLALPGGHLVVTPDGLQAYYQEINLSPIAPGARGTVSFTGIVNLSLMQVQYEACRRTHPDDPAACDHLYDLVRTARIDTALTSSLAGSVVANSYGVEHPVVADPPVDVVISSPQDQMAGVPAALDLAAAANPGLPQDAWQQALASPPIYLQPGTNTLQGSAHDPSGVPTVKVQLLDPSGETSDIACTVTAPMSGQWSCGVDIAEAPTGTRYFARVQATNTFGYTSEWSPWRALVIDTRPPTAALDMANQVVLSATVLGRGATILSGVVEDNYRVSSVDVCLGQVSQARPYKTYLPLVSRSQQAAGKTSRAASAPLVASEVPVSCQAVNLNATAVISGSWSYALLVPANVDFASQTLYLYGRDVAGNRSDTAFKQTVWLDTVPPVVNVATQVVTVSLAAYRANPLPLLGGRATDGGGQPGMVVRMTSPQTGVQRIAVPVNANIWNFIPDLQQTGVYALELEAWDRAGNMVYAGPWTLTVID